MSNQIEALEYRDLIDKNLRAIVNGFSNQSQELHRAMNAAILPLGKGFRGSLMLLVAAQTGEMNDMLIDTACAIEMLHAASLVIDDLPAMDNAAMRRGQPSNHKVFGEDTAILAGIAIVADTLGFIARSPHADFEIRAQLVEILARATGSGGLCAGQEMDLRAAKSTENIGRVYDLKTGALFVAAFEAISIIQNLDEDKRAQLQHFAECLGRVFQTCDDLLDALGHSAELGKDVGKDILHTEVGTGYLAFATLDETLFNYQYMQQELRNLVHTNWPQDQTIMPYMDSVLPNAESFLERARPGVYDEKSSVAG